jgi:hypothetical protein
MVSKIFLWFIAILDVFIENFILDFHSIILRTVVIISLIYFIFLFIWTLNLLTFFYILYIVFIIEKTQNRMK